MLTRFLYVLPTLLVSLLLLALLILIILKLRSDRKKGRSSCGCNCGHCPMNGTCHNGQPAERKRQK